MWEGRHAYFCKEFFRCVFPNILKLLTIITIVSITARWTMVCNLMGTQEEVTQFTVARSLSVRFRPAVNFRTYALWNAEGSWSEWRVLFAICNAYMWISTGPISITQSALNICPKIFPSWILFDTLRPTQSAYLLIWNARAILVKRVLRLFFGRPAVGITLTPVILVVDGDLLWSDRFIEMWSNSVPLQISGSWLHVLLNVLAPIIHGML